MVQTPKKRSFFLSLPSLDPYPWFPVPRYHFITLILLLRLSVSSFITHHSLLHHPHQPTSLPPCSLIIHLLIREFIHSLYTQSPVRFSDLTSSQAFNEFIFFSHYYSLIRLTTFLSLIRKWWTSLLINYKMKFSLTSVYSLL